MAFDRNTLYTLLKAKLKDDCTVGRYVTPKESQYPYLDMDVSDISGGHYDLQNNEGSQNVMVTLMVYCSNYNDAKCLEVSVAAKELMLSYGFQCMAGPMKVDNTDPAVARWVARYKRIFAAGDELRKVH